MLIIIGICYAAALGVSVLPFKPIAGVVINGVSSVTGEVMDPLLFASTSFILGLGQILLFLLIGKFVVKPDVSPLQNASDPFAQYRSRPFTSTEKVAGIILACVLSATFLPSVLPDHWWITIFLAKFSMTAVFAFALVIVMAIKINGKPYADIPKAFSAGIQWPTIIMLACSIPLANMMKDPASGVTDLFTRIILRLLDGAAPLMVGIIFVIFVGILTQFAHNLVLAIVLAPILANIGLILGFNPWPIAILLSMMANLGIATPGASVLGAMVFANKEWVTPKNGSLYSFTLVIASIIFLCVLGVPFVYLFF